MTKVLIVFGTRPEAIKMCPVVKAMTNSKTLQPIVCITSQHRQMLDQVLQIFKVAPQYDLNIMKDNQTLSDITISVLKGITDILIQERPAIVLVHGDTTTAFAAALACFYLKIPVGHVEAGLRTYNIFSPYPEEFNRQSIDVISNICFAPTENSKQNLLHEGRRPNQIFVTGNTGIDALNTTINDSYQSDDLEWAKGSRMILLTAHRRENLGEPMAQMFQAIRRVVDEYKDIKVIYPIHLNPQVRSIAEKVFRSHPRIRLIEPLDTIDFHNYLKSCYLVLTDSGGIQEEAPSLGKPVLVMRNTTERPEGVQAGTLKLVGTDEESIYNNFKLLLDDTNEYTAMSHASNPYGDGHASERIVATLEDLYA